MSIFKGKGGTQFLRIGSGHYWNPPATMVPEPDGTCHTLGDLGGTDIHIGVVGNTQCCGARSLYSPYCDFTTIEDAMKLGGGVFLLHTPTSPDPTYRDAYVPPMVTTLRKALPGTEISCDHIEGNQWLIIFNVKDIKAFRAWQYKEPM